MHCRYVPQCSVPLDGLPHCAHCRAHRRRVASQNASGGAADQAKVDIMAKMASTMQPHHVAVGLTQGMDQSDLAQVVVKLGVVCEVCGACIDGSAPMQLCVWRSV